MELLINHQFLSAIASTFWGAKIAQKILWLVWFFRTTINFFELSYFSVYRSSTFSHARRLSSSRTLLNYGRPKGQFGSSHEKFETWTKNPSYLVRSLLYIKRCPHISFLLTRCGSYSNVHCDWVSSFRTEELFVQLRCHVDEARVSTKDWSQVQKEDWTNCQVIRAVCLRQRPEVSLDWVVKSIKRSLQVNCAKWLFLGNRPPTPPLSQHLLLT